jgi:hypothetical protein
MGIQDQEVPTMVGKIGEKQEWLIARLYDAKTGERLVEITRTLADVFFNDEHPDNYTPQYHKCLLFQTRRALAALIRRGLVEEASAARREHSRWASNRHRPFNRAYRLTDVGVELARTNAAREAAAEAAWAAANPEAAQRRAEAWAQLAEAFAKLPK